MSELLYELAKFILDNPELKKKKNYEIYNIWFSKRICPLDNIEDVKFVLEYINDIKNISTNLLADALERGKQ